MTKVEWVAESMRFTIFLSGMPDVDRQWWTTIAGQPPLARNASPRQGTLQEEGPFGGFKLTFGVQPFRIDCVLTAQEDRSPTEFVSLGRADDALPVFRQVVAKLLSLEGLLPITRVAFGLILLSPVSDRESGYSLLAERIPVKLDVANSSEFLYQINRPRELQIEGKTTKINRISKWMVSQVRLLAMQIGPENQAFQGEGSYAMRLELDVNTAPVSGRSFEANAALQVVETLIQASLEIGEKGDIA